MTLARLLVLLACRPAEDAWPVCGNEAELTAEDYGGVGTLRDEDFLVCGDLPADGSACPDYHDVDPYALFAAEVGPWQEGSEGYELRSDCGPETTRDDACCYVVEVDGMFVVYE